MPGFFIPQCFITLHKSQQQLNKTIRGFLIYNCLISLTFTNHKGKSIEQT